MTNFTLASYVSDVNVNVNANDTYDAAAYYDYSDANTTGISDAVMYINIFVIPIFVLVGIVGNTISFIVFVYTHLKYNSSSVYLAALNIVDTGFLLSLIPAWLGWVHVDIFHTDGWCQITIYFAYVFAFLSVWIVVSFTAERFVVVFYPLRRSSMCTIRRALMMVCILVGFAMVYYSYALWATSVEDYEGLPTCLSKSQYHAALRVLSVVDTVITLVVPSALIIILNSSISCKLILYYKKHANSTNTSHRSSNKSTSSSSGLPPAAAHDGGGGGGGGGGLTERLHHPTKDATISSRTPKSVFCISQAQVQLQRRRNFQNRTTRTLLLISTIFVVLNLPSHLFRIFAVLSALTGYEYSDTYTMSLLQELSLLSYYANFASNLFLYTLCSNSFRKALIKLKNRMVRYLCHKSSRARNAKARSNSSKPKMALLVHNVNHKM